MVAAALLSTASPARADIFDTNGTTAGFGITANTTYDWLTSGYWSDTATLDTGDVTTATWQGTAAISENAYFAGLGTAGQSYTIRLGATGTTNVYIGNLALNSKADGSGALTGALGDLTIGSNGDSGNLILRAANSIGALAGGTLTINNGINLNAQTMNFRGGSIVVNGVVSGTGASKILFGSGAFGLTTGTLTLANTANTYAGRTNADYIPVNYTVIVTKLSNGGTASSLGTSTANIGLNGGTLKFVGVGAQSTNLGLNLGSATSLVEASGPSASDTITITGAPTYSATNSNRSFTLTGTNIGANTIGFIYGNNGTGVNSLTKSGAGTWVLTGANTYTGATTISAGTLNIQHSTALGTSAGITTIAKDAKLQIQGDGLSIAENFTIGNNQAGTIENVSGNNTLTGTITKAGGVNLLSTSGKLTVTGGIGGTNNTVNTQGAGDGEISGAISVAYGFNKTGTGTWTLSGANTYSTYSSVTEGTLQLGSSGVNNAISGVNLTIGGANNTAATVRYTGTSSDMISAATATITVNGRGILDFNGKTDTIGNVVIVSTGATTTNPTPVINTAGGGNLTIGTLAITPVAGFASVINSGTGTLTLGGGVTFNAATTGRAQISGNIDLGTASRTFTVATGTGTGEDLLLDAVIASAGGTYGLTKAGAGRMTLAGANSYTGTTTVSAGTLKLAKTSALYNGSTASWTASNIIVASGATIALNVGGSGEFSASDVGLLLSNLGGANGGAGAGFASGANLALDTSNAAGGNFTLSEVIADSSSTGGGAVNLVKLGSGILTLTGTNTFTGNITVNGTVNGGVRITSNDALGTSTTAKTVNLYQGTNGVAELDLDPGSGLSLTLSDRINFLVSSNSTTGSGIVSRSGINEIRGKITLQAGYASAAVSSSSGSTLTISGTVSANAATRTLYLGGSSIAANTISGAMNNSAGNGDFGVSKGDEGRWILSGINTYSGTTTINAGTLILSGTNTGTGATNVIGGTLQAGADDALNPNSAVTMTDAAASLLDLNDKTGTIASLSGGGAAGGNVTLGTGTLTTGATGSSTTYSGNISGTGNLIKSGDGIFTLSSAQSYSGLTTVSKGTLLVNNTLASAATTVSGGTLGGTGTLINSVIVASGGTLSPATTTTAGTLTIGSLTLEPGSALSMEFGSSNDLISVTASNGLVINGGALSLFSAGGLLPLTSNGDYTLFTYQSGYAGSKDNLTVANSQAGKAYSVTDTGSSLVLSIGTATASTWVGGSGTWSGTNNWDNTTPPAGFGSVANFGPASSSPSVISVDGPKTVGAIILDNVSGYTLSGTDSLTLDNGIAAGAISTISGSHTIEVPVILANPGNLSPAFGTSLTLTGNISGAKPLTFSGSGTTILTGTNSYGATNINSGKVQVGNGSAGGTLGTGAVTMASGTTLEFNRTGSYSTAAVITGTSATLTIVAGEIALSGAKSLSTINLSGGTVVLSGTNAASTINASGANFEISNAAVTTLNLSGGTGTFAGTNVLTNFNLSGGTAKAGSSTAFGSAVPVFSGTGTLDLNGNNLNFGGNGFTGVAGNTVTDSSIETGTSTLSYLASTANITTAMLIADGAFRKVAVAIGNANNGHQFTNNNNTFSGGLTLVGTTNGTRLTVSAVPSNTFENGILVAGPYGTGPITIGQVATDLAGIYVSTANTTIANPIVFNTGLGTDRAGMRYDSIGNTLTGTITANNASATFSTNSTGAVTVANKITGTHGLTLDNAFGTTITVTLNNTTGVANDYQGDTRIAGTKGVLVLGSANQIPDGATAGNLIVNGTFRLGGFSETINGLTGVAAGIIDGMSGTPTLTVGANDQTSSYAGVLRNTAGSMSLTKVGTGTLTLSGTNTHAGDTSVSGGVLALSNNLALQNSALDTSGGGAVSLAVTTPTFGGLKGSANLASFITTGYGAVTGLTLNPATGVSNTYSGGISDGATGMTLTKTGAGTQVLAGANSYTGATTVSAGVLALGHADALAGTSSITVSTGGPTLRVDVPDSTSTSTGAGKSVSIAGTGLNNYGALVGADSASVTWAGNVVLTTDSRIGGGNGGTLTVDGTISGAFNVLFSRAPNSVTVLKGQSTYSGDTQLFPGDSTVNLKMGTSNAISSASRVSISNATSGTAYFDLNGFNQNVRAVADSVGGDLIVTNGSTSADAELRLNPTDTQTFNGWIQDGASRKIAVVLTGTASGSQIFQGSNTYTGGTTIRQGSLILQSGDNRLAPTGTVSLGDVSSTGKLVIGETTLARSQTLAGLTATGLGGSVVGAAAAANSTLTLNIATGTNIFEGTLGGGGANENNLSLTKTGNGVLVLSGNNTYVGGTTISGGKLQVGNASASGTIGAGNVVNEGSLEFNRSDDFSVANLISGSGSVTKAGNGTLTLSAVNTYTGVTTVSGGTLALSGASNNNIASSSGISLGNGTTLSVAGLTSGTLILASGQSLSATGATATVTGTALTINGNNTLSTTGGTLTLPRLNVFGTGNQFTGGNLSSGGTNRGLVIGSSTGAGALTISGGSFSTAGAQQADVIGNDQDATLTVNGGTFTGTATTVLGLNSGLSWTSTLTVSGSGTANLSLLQLSAANSVVNLDGGTLTVQQIVDLDNQGVTGASNTTFNFNGGLLRAAAGANATFLNGLTNAFVEAGGASIDTNGQNITVGQALLADAVSTGGGLTKSGNGTLTLSGNNTYTGTTTVSAGTLQVGNGSTSGSLGSGDIVNAGVLAFDRSDDLVVANAISGAGSLSKSGNGTLTLSGTNTFTGGVTINGGALSVGNVAALNATAGSENTVAFGAGSTGTLRLTGNSVVIANLTTNATPGTAIVENAASTNATLTVGNSANLSGVFAGILRDGTGGGSLGLTKTGNGTLALTGANTFTGQTTVSVGTLNLGNGGSTGSLYAPSVTNGNLTFGAAGAIVNNGALAYQLVGGDVHVNKTITGSGTISVSGDRSVHFADGTTITTTGAQTYSATATGGRYYGFNLAENASVALTSSGAISMTGMLGTSNSNSGNLTLDTSAGNGNVTLNTAVGVANVDFGLGSLTVRAGTGAISLGGFSGYSSWGTATTIALTGGDVSSSVAMNAFSTLTVTNTGTGTFSGLLSGSGSFTKSGAGTLTLSALNTFGGGTTVSGGTLNIDVQGDQTNSAVGVNKAVTVASGATLRLAQTDGLGYYGANPSSLVIAGTMTIAAGKHASIGNFGLTLDGGTLTAEGAGSTEGNYIFDGTVTTLANASASVIDAQLVKLRNGSGAANQAVTFDVADGAASTDLTVSSALANGNGANGLIKAGTGTLALTGSNTFTGGTTVNGGTLALGGSQGVLRGAVTINSGGTVSMAAGNNNRYWDVASTRINAGGLLTMDSHSHLRNLTLAGGELGGSGGDPTYGTWYFDDATTVTGGVVSTLSAQQINLNNGNLTIEAGSTLNFTGSVKGGSFTPTIAAGGKFVNAAAANTSLSLGTLTLNGGELAATSTPASNLGNYQLRGDVTVGGSSMSTISADVRVISNENRVFDVADVDGASGVDLLLSGNIGHYNGVSGGSFTKAGAGTMRISGTTAVYSGTANAGRLILEDNAVEGWWQGGLATNAVVEFALTGAKTANYAISGSGSLTKSGNGTLTLSGNNSFGGGLTIQAGTLRATRNTLGTGAVVVNNGATLHANDQWVFCGANGYGEAQRNISSLTLNAGATLHMDATQGFANGISNFYLNGGTVTGGANDDTRGALYLYGGNEQITAGGNATSTIGVSIGLNGINNSITVDSGSRLEMTNVLKRGAFDNAGRGGIVKNGAGTLVLSGANSFDGQVDITAGTLIAANNTALGAGGHAGETQSWIRDGATLALQGGISLDEHFHVWGAGVGGLGAVRSLSGDNALTNAPGGNAGFCLRSNTTVGVDAGTLTVSGFYEDGGSFGLTKVGDGTLVLNVLNSYTGGTTVNGGTLILPGNGGFGRISGALTVNAGATVATTGDGSGFGFNDQLTSLTINGGLVKADASTSHIWNLTGGITMTGGELQSNGGVSSDSANALQWNRTSLTTNASASSAVISGRVALRGDAGYTTWNITVADGAAAADLLVSAAITGGGVALAKSGEGRMVLSGANTYTGATVINGGTLAYQNTYASPSHAVASGAVLEFNTAGGERDGAATTFTGAGTLRKTGDGGIIWGPGTATFALDSGALIDVQAGLFTGGSYGNDNWTNNKSDLNVAAGATFNTVEANVRLNKITGSGTIRTGFGGAGYANLTIGVDNGSSTFAGVIADANAQGNLVKTGSGTITLSGASTYSGVTTLAGGVLEVTSLADNGTASSLGVGTGDTNGDLTGILFQGGTLRYAGSTAQSTNRSIRLSTTGGGGTIDASGSTPEATVSFTRASMVNWWENGGTRTLTLTGTNTGANTLAAGINDFGGSVTTINVNKEGAGTWVLSGAGNYLGLTDIKAGMLVAASNGALGTGGHRGDTMTYIRDGATLALQGGISLDEHLHVWGAGVGGLGAIRSLSGDNALTNTNNGAAGFALRANTTVGVDAGTLTVAGFYEDQGSFGLTKVGNGTLALTVPSTYTGATTVTGGALNAAAGALANTSGITVTGAALTAVDYAAAATLTVDASGTAVVSGANLNLSGAVTNNGSAAAALNFTASTGTITLASLSGSGKTRFGRDAAITGGISSGDVTVVGALSADISGGTVNTGALTGAITGGTTTVSGVATISSVTAGTVNLNGATSSIATLTAGTINLGTTALTVQEGTFTGLLAGAQGSLIKASAGTLTLSGANSFGGGTTINAGTLVIGQAGSLGSGAITVASGASLDLANFSVSNVITAANGASIINGPSTATVTTTGSQSVDTVLTGTGGLTKSDGGELTLTTPNFFTGGVSATTAGAVISAAHLADGSSSLGASALNDPTKLVLGNGATLEFTGTTATTTSRSFTVSGSAALAVDASAAALTFSSASIMALDPADPTPQLKLVANNSGVNRFEAQISADDLAAGRGISNLVIDGTGQWVLGGAANRFKGDVRMEVGGGATLGFEAGALGTGSTYASSVIEVGNGSKLSWAGNNNTDDISGRLSVPAGATAKLDLGDNNVTFASAPSVGTGGSLEKQGTGTLKIAAAVNAPTLNVAITGGRLAVNGTLGNITLAQGATLGGSGTIGTATVASGAIVAPGNSPGLLNGASMTLSGGAIFEWEVQNATSTSGYDRINLTGDLDLRGANPGSRVVFKVVSRLGSGDGNTVGDPLNFAPPGGAASIRTFQFGQVGGVLLNSGQNISDVFSFDLSQFTYSDGSASNAGLWSINWDSGTGAITVTAVPEPSTYGLGLGALALAAAALRRRRRQAPQA